MKISIITVCKNAEKTIEKTILSVIEQDYNNIEYIVIDGLSSDNTCKIIEKHKAKITAIVSETDHGMYDALNKGIKIAKGEIIGMLNADDVLAKFDIISKIAEFFSSNSAVDTVIGDVLFTNENGKHVRYYSSAKWHPSQFAWGFMPAHPTFYCKAKYFNEIGNYSLDYTIASDFELLIRFLKINELKFVYLPLLMVKMKIGGKTAPGIRTALLISKELLKACKKNNIYTNYFMLYSRYVLKIFEWRKKTKRPVLI